MGVHVENLSFHELEPEISWVKGVPGALPLAEGGGAKHSPPGETCENS